MTPFEKHRSSYTTSGYYIVKANVVLTGDDDHQYLGDAIDMTEEEALKALSEVEEPGSFTLIRRIVYTYTERIERKVNNAD